LGYLLRSQETTTLALGISNQDQPVAPLNLSLAARLVDALKTNDRLIVTPLSGDANAVREAVRNGTVDAALVFSPTFTADLLARKPVSLQLVLEGANPAK